MALIEREAALAIAAATAATSPRAREIARQGLVYGLAGVLKAGDVAVSAGRGAYEGARAGFEASSAPQPEPTKRSSGAKPASAKKSSGAKTAAAKKSSGAKPASSKKG